MDLDMSEFEALAKDLARAGLKARPAIRPVIQKGGVVLKAQLRAEAEGVAHAPALPSTISYETTERPDGVSLEVGPTEGGAGSLALLYYGNSKTGPVLKDPVFALKREADVMVKHITDVIVKASRL
jgi:hypothetical protein